MLTKDDLNILKQPFAASEHEFLKGNAYITEAAITERIEQIDPAWTLEQVSMFNRADSNQVVCTMRLTIKGVWRDGVGMSQITKLKSGDGEANEAEKSAATDAMKRAARLFGIGRYLLSLPDGVRDPVSMKNYLEGKKGNPYGGKPATTPPPAQNAANANVGTNNVTFDWFTKPVGETWKDLHPYLLEHIYNGNKIGKEKSFAHHAKLTKQWAGMTAGEVVKYLETRHDEAS